MTLREICINRTQLREQDIQQLEALAGSMQMMADLTASDIFLVCMERTGRLATVAAQIAPRHGRLSLYQNSIVGKTILRKNAPAVYHSLESGLPMREMKATTLDGKMVRQDVAAVISPDGHIIGALVRERDKSSGSFYEKKYREILNQNEGSTSYFTKSLQIAAMREVHHRVKNSLQLIASILNLQARQAVDEETRQMFEKNTARVLSIASTHDIISGSNSPNGISLRDLLERVAKNLEMIAAGTRSVTIKIEGDHLIVNADVGSSVALVVNELISNSLEHAFAEGESGAIEIEIYSGELYSTVWVEDNGHGFDLDSLENQGLGLRLVTLTVREKLGGELRISSSKTGTRASFDFKNGMGD